ncbi:MAG TPA: hypothetical protein VFF70_10740 [Anaerolineae bacterium]|nr:hypothetical protein [Anaerolineae bacterium]
MIPLLPIDLLARSIPATELGFARLVVMSAWYPTVGAVYSICASYLTSICALQNIRVCP